MYKNYKGIKADKVIYPGLNLNIFHPANEKKQKNVLILGTIGRTEVFKGTGYILDAFKILRKELGEKVELHIAFGNEEWSKIDGVTMHYPKGDLQLADYYRSLDCYICAQYIQLQAVHYPVIETMACGIPLITTGYYPSNENNSWIIKPKDPKDIVSKVWEMIKNPDLTQKRKDIALQSIKEFEWNTLAEKMINFF